jgi:hypothetical protein
MRKVELLLLCLVVETSFYVILYFKVCTAYPNQSGSGPINLRYVQKDLVLWQ